jgi:hypothetical protein
MLHSTFKLGLAAILALGGAAVAANAHSDGKSDNLACGVNTSTEGRMISIEGVLQSPEAMTGEYRFALKSSGPSGSSNISQGGAFSATADTRLSLGKVMLNAGSHTEIDFTITSGGKKFDCSQQLATPS